jgi:prevent-host-death family protein
MTILHGHEGIAMNINAAQFKAKCLKLIDEVAATRKPLTITKRGKPLAKLVPIDDKALPPLFGYMKGTGQILGDIVNVPHDAWAAETGEEDDLYRRTPPKPTKKADR